MRRLCVGALHGLYQNKAVFAQKTQSLRAVLPEAAVDLEYLDAPHRAVPAVLRSPKTASKKNTRLAGADSLDFKGWWNPTSSGNLHVEEETLETLRKVGAQFKQDHVTGVIGFSQGGALAALLCCKDVQRLINWGPEFVILCCAYESKLPFHSQLLSSGIDPRIRSLHVGGAKDQVVPATRSRELSKLFHGPVFVESPGGHQCPTDEPTLLKIREFIGEMQPSLIAC